MSEAARSDLYNGLSEVLGPDRAETLMSFLPRYEPEEVAATTGIAEVRAGIAEVRTDLREGLAAVNQRLDLLFLTLLVGMLGVMAAIVGVFLRIP